MSNIDKQELSYWIAFNQLTEFGPKRFSKLLAYFPDLKTAWAARLDELLQSGLETKVAEKLIISRTDINPSLELEKVDRAGIEVITLNDHSYPAKLKEISNPPALLYCKGRLFDSTDEYAMAVVGTRKITPYGQQVTRDIVTELTQYSLTIVSGLALGVDAAAHKSCLEAKGRTIAVLGNGLDSIYPSSNVPLAKRILDQDGLIISEYALGTPSFKSNFPHRNRIISGLCLGTLIIEADSKSGSLITANLALEQNRDVFAVPGSIYSASSKGPHKLLKAGAQVVTHAQDIIQALSLEQIPEIIKTREIVPDTPDEKTILDLLKLTPQTTDMLIKQSGLDAKKINSILVGMELKGMIRNQGATTYTIAM